MRTLSVYKAPIIFFALILIFPTSGTPADHSLIFHDIDIELYPSEHRLKASDVLEFTPTSTPLCFFIRKSLRVDGVRINGEDVIFEESLEYEPEDHTGETGSGKEPKPAYENAKLVKIAGDWGEERIKIEVHYGGVIFDSLTVPEFSRTSIADQTTGLIEERGAFLSEESFWYPSFEGYLHSFRLTTTTPAGYETVSQGRRISRDEAGDKVITVWKSNCPGDVIYLVMGKWDVTVLHHNGIKIYAFFFHETNELVETYLEKSASYVDMYEDMIGPYPYGKFAIVENFFPTGYGMPSFTLLGSSVIRLPFIVYTSLGHEVLHNWWGNGVFVDYESGNWCEGLTTYLADHLYKEKQSAEKGIEYRKNLLRDYSVYVTETNDEPVRTFTSRTTPATRAVGYGKVAMIFHQLKRYLGEVKFERALRILFQRFLFEKASWEDIQNVFSEVGGEDLSWYFSQWVDRGGAPTIELEKVRARKEDGRYVVSFRLKQIIDGENLYKLFVPVELETENGLVEELIVLSDFAQGFEIRTESPPRKLLIDQGYDVFRRLDPMEIEPTISMALGDKNAIIVIPSSSAEEENDRYREVAQALRGKEEQVRILPDEELTESDIRTRSLFVIGRPEVNSVARRFSADLPEGFSVEGGKLRINGMEIAEPASVVIVLRNPYNSKKAITLFSGSSLEEILAPSRKIVHYGNYSYLSFHGGKIGEKGILEGDANPMVFSF